MKLSRKALALQKNISELMAHQPNDLRLRDHLEGLGKDPALPGLTWFWGPELYKRNRVVFREFILAHFSEYDTRPLRSWVKIRWSDHAARLEGWLELARKVQDTGLVRRLLHWKHSGSRWNVDDEAYAADLVRAYGAAATPGARARILEQYENWFHLDESSASQLYSIDSACSSFILRHLPANVNFLGCEKRKLWRVLHAAALAAGDRDLAETLYRRQIPTRHWRKDVIRLAGEIEDPDALCTELLRRHPEGWGLNLVGGLVDLLKARGRDVMPYLRENLAASVYLYGGSLGAAIKVARKDGCWDLWAALIRASSSRGPFNKAVRELVKDRTLDDSTCQERLRALAGASVEFNWPGLSIAVVHPLKEAIAVELYTRYPDLVRGPFKPHILPTGWVGARPKLLAAAQAANDHELVDALASRYVTWASLVIPVISYLTNQQAILECVESLATFYQALRDHDPVTFARRASSVLTQIPAYSIHGYSRLLRTNVLARLLFVRWFDAYLAAPGSVRDLVEASNMHVQKLGYQILARDDPAARKLAAELLDIVQGTLLRPLHRQARLVAFAALRNAAKYDDATAARVLARARQALRLPNRQYPKDELVGLIAAILSDHPDLRGPCEQPPVHRLSEATA